jgi:hypothetical protein
LAAFPDKCAPTGKSRQFICSFGNALIWWRRCCRTAVRRGSGASTRFKSGNNRTFHAVAGKEVHGFNNHPLVGTIQFNKSRASQA